jgi:hypothetical protein
MEFALQLRVSLDIPPPEREFKFHPSRKWRFDFVWRQFMIAAECEGGVFTHGRHTRGTGFVEDAEKYNEAAILGWKVLRFPAPLIKDGSALQQLRRAMGLA